MSMNALLALTNIPRRCKRREEIARYIAVVCEKLRFVMLEQDAWRVIRRGKEIELEVLCKEEIMGLELFAVQTWVPGVSSDLSGLPRRVEEVDFD